MEHNGKLTPNATWPAVVDETTWRGVAAILSDPSRRTTPGPAPRHLLSYIARCGLCGGPMICTSTTVTSAPGKRRLVYRCREDGPGRHPQRDAGHLDELIAERVIARLSQPDAADVLAKPDDGRKEQLAHLYQEKAAIEALMEERDKLHRRRVITDKMLIEGLAELQEELARGRAAYRGHGHAGCPLAAASRSGRSVGRDQPGPAARGYPGPDDDHRKPVPQGEAARVETRPAVLQVIVSRYPVPALTIPVCAVSGTPGIRKSRHREGDGGACGVGELDLHRAVRALPFA